MEYHQITLNEWLEAKEKLRRAVLKAANGFIELGYELRQIEEQKLYEAGGYSSIAEFAEKEPEFGLSPSLVSRLISVNKAFADPEHPRQIKTDYNRYGMAKLTEMLNLPESDREMIRPETRRDDIRELKRFNKESEKAAVGLADEEHGMDDMHILVRDFFEKNAEILNAIYSSEAYTFGDITKMAEIVNPSGNKTFRKGITIMMMYEDSIKIKKLMQEEKMSATGTMELTERQLIMLENSLVRTAEEFRLKEQERIQREMKAKKQMEKAAKARAKEMKSRAGQGWRSNMMKILPQKNRKRNTGDRTE